MNFTVAHANVTQDDEGLWRVRELGHNYFSAKLACSVFQMRLSREARRYRYKRLRYFVRVSSIFMLFVEKVNFFHVLRLIMRKVEYTF